MAPDHSITSLFLAIIFCCLLTFCFLHTHKKNLSGHIPGPFFARYTSTWLALHTRRQRRHLDDIALHEKYGPVVQVAPHEVLISSPSAVRMIYGMTSGKSLPKGEWYSVLGSGPPHPLSLDLFAEPNMAKYRLQRRLIGPIYSASSIKDLASNLDSLLKIVDASMQRMQGQEVDLDTWCHLLALDCLCMVVLSQSMGLVEKGRDNGSVEALRGSWKRTHWTSQLPTIHKLNVWCIKITGSNLWREKPLEAPVFAWAAQTLSKRMTRSSFTDETEHLDIASKLISLHNSNNAFTARWLTEMTLSHFGAGTETLGITLASLLHTIISTPNLQAKIHTEIDSVKASQTATPALYQLPYLQACLRESMRLSPVIGVPFPRLLPEDTHLIIDGFKISVGTTVGTNPWALNRTPELYGSDAEDFRPERWLEMSINKRKEVEAHNLTFGMGMRSCPGKHIAMSILERVIPALMEFEWGFKESVEEHKRICRFGVRWEGVGVSWKPRAGGK